MAQVDRRQFLGAAGALTAMQMLPGRALAAGPVRGDAAVEAMLAQMAEELLVEYPENAAGLGLDKGDRAVLKARLTDRSAQGARAHAEAAAKRLARLKAIDLDSVSAATRTDVGVVRIAPYVVAQNTGAFIEVPDFLDSNHEVANAADADAYLARMEAYAAGLDGETGRLSHDAGIGVIAPSFLLDKTLRQMTGARAQPIAEWTLIKSLEKRAAALGGGYAAQAAKIAQDRIAPALDRQIAELTRQRTKATADAGVWKLPDGEAYYAWALRAATTSRMTPDEVHRLGLEQVKMLAAQMDVLLREQGLTKGSVGARMTALGQDPKYLYPNTNAGRTQILDYINDRVADIRTRLPRAFATLMPGKLVVKRVPPEIEQGAPGGYASAGSIDGTLPGNYYINLRDTSMWPKYSLPTLTYHEGIPGHIWQGEYTYKLPLIRSLLAFNAYSEGWALYAEQIADELGAYDQDPLGRLGYLQSMSFRACRLVVDTGIHAKRWTRAQAITWFAETNGSTVEEVQGEVDRYCAWPGQACGYKAGHIEINRLRNKAIAALGDRYDLRLFDDAVVKGGNVPLTLLEHVIDAYILAGKA